MAKNGFRPPRPLTEEDKGIIVECRDGSPPSTWREIARAFNKTEDQVRAAYRSFKKAHQTDIH